MSSNGKKEGDVLPDTNIDRERTLTGMRFLRVINGRITFLLVIFFMIGNWALICFVVVAVFTFLAFCTPHWIEGDPRFYGTKVEKVGLWVHCFR